MKWNEYINKNVCYILCIVFILSGFVKGVDVFGTELKIREYAKMLPYFIDVDHKILAFIFPSLEVFLGICLLLLLYKRMVISIVFLVMVAFSILTAFLAFDPYISITDCGCFGDAIHLTNKESFYKNILILLLCGLALYQVWREPRKKVGKREWVVGGYFFLFSLAIPMYSYYYLPPFDFLTYNRGVDLNTHVDFACYDERLFDVTDSVIRISYESPLFAVVKQGELSREEKSKLKGLLKLERAGEVVAVGWGDPKIEKIENYYVSELETKSMVRAKSGVILIVNGVIRGKWNLNQTKVFKDLEKKDVDELIERGGGLKLRYMASLCIASLFGIAILKMPIRWFKKKI